MRLPNKITSFEESDLARYSFLLEKLEKQGMTVTNLYEHARLHIDDINTYLSLLDGLYALQVLELDHEKGVIKYARRDEM